MCGRAHLLRSSPPTPPRLRLGGGRRGLDLPERSLTYSASVGNPGEAPFQLAKLCFCQIFKRQELVAGSFAGSDQLI